MIRWCVIVVLMATPAFADTYCYSRGKNTYCDNGTTFHQTPNGGIVTYGPTGKTTGNYHRYGNKLYGNDDSWRAKHGKNKITGNLKNTPTENDRALDEIFGGDWSDD